MNGTLEQADANPHLVAHMVAAGVRRAGAGPLPSRPASPRGIGERTRSTRGGQCAGVPCA
jgi:hypothetical protein